MSAGTLSDDEAERGPLADDEAERGPLAASVKIFRSSESSGMVLQRELPNIPEAKNELDVCMALQGHPGILKLRGHEIFPDKITISTEHHPKTILEMLFSQIEDLPMPLIFDIFNQLVSALEFVHQRGFILKSLALNHLLITDTNQVLISDFEMAVPFQRGTRTVYSKSGVIFNAAPEIWSKTPCEGPEIDIWSLGICLYQMVTRSLPFHSDSTDSAPNFVAFYEPLACPPSLASHSDLFDLLKRMLRLDPLNRIALSSAMAHPWIVSMKSCSSESVSVMRLPLRPLFLDQN